MLSGEFSPVIIYVALYGANLHQLHDFGQKLLMIHQNKNGCIKDQFLIVILDHTMEWWWDK